MSNFPTTALLVDDDPADARLVEAGLVSWNGRKFRHPNSSPATGASRPTTLPLMRKVQYPCSRMCRQAAGEMCVISASVLALPRTSIFVSSRDRMAELSWMTALAIRGAHGLLISILMPVRPLNSFLPPI